jgi:hypothetical protein
MSSQLHDATLQTTNHHKTMTTTDTITRKFQVRFQLGGYGSEHSKLSAAIRAMQAAERRARRGGDCQGIYIQVNEYRDGRFYGHGELTETESMEIQSL